MNSLRKLVYRFCNLPFHKQIEIVDKLKITKEEDSGVEENELMKYYFKRIGEKNLFKELWDEVENNYEDKIENPF